MKEFLYPVLLNENERLAALADYDFVNGPPGDDFNRLAGLAARLFKVPIALVSIVEKDRQFFRARVGLDLCETAREVSFCTHAIVQDDILFVPDATKDPRFANNPLVLGPPFIRFYAGKALTLSQHKIGTVCLIDTVPRDQFTPEDRKNLSDIAALVADRMEMHRLDYVQSVSQARFENIAATSPDAIICSNSDGDITFWNKSAERLFGYTAHEMVAASSEIIVPDSWRRIYDAELERLRNGQKLELAGRTVELSGLRKDGGEFPAEFSLSTWQEGNAPGVGAIVRDITERRQNEERLFRLASLDALTDLPNRGAWRERLTAVLADGTPASVLLMDLDGFKDVNDTLGHPAGDAVLKEVAARLRATCEGAVKVARLGGDEFVVLLSGDDVRQATAMATRMISAVSAPYEFAGQKVEIGASVGIAFAPRHSTRPDELLSAADLALYKAKSAGKGRYEVFAPVLREVAVVRRAFEAELKHAFESGELVLFYQPQVSMADRRITGAEALMRWNHPQRGLLSPASFIDVLNQKPSAAAVGEWVLRTACEAAAKWRAVLPSFRIGVNLSQAQFRSRRLLSTVRQALEDYRLPPEALELEIVENIYLSNDAPTLKILRDLREWGVGLALDDYGTGYASLSLLKRYPITRLKIDRSFVREVNTDPTDAAVVKAMLYLAENFRIEAIAEGVETEAQMDFLRVNQCSEAQGYLFGKPVASADFERKYVSAD